MRCPSEAAQTSARNSAAQAVPSPVSCLPWNTCFQTHSKRHSGLLSLSSGKPEAENLLILRTKNQPQGIVKHSKSLPTFQCMASPPANTALQVPPRLLLLAPSLHLGQHQLPVLVWVRTDTTRLGVHTLGWTRLIGPLPSSLEARKASFLSHSIVRLPTPVGANPTLRGGR